MRFEAERSKADNGRSWDFDDTYSWVPSTFAGQGYADLFFQPKGAGTPLVKKAAYDGCLQALQGKPEAL